MKVLDYEIKIIWAVKELNSVDWSWESDNNHWTGFHLWYVYANGVKIVVEGEEYNLTTGDSFIFDLSKNHYCTHDPKKQAGLYTIYFRCDKEQQLQQMLKSNQILKVNHLSTFDLNCKLFNEIIKYNENEIVMDMWATPIFYQLFTCCKNQSDENDPIRKFCVEIENSPQARYKLDDICKHMGYSKNHFIRLFKKTVGDTPYSYILNAKIKKAKNLLLFSNFTATQIAVYLGYNDVNHFSSQFFKKVGCYPSQYVKTL